ncbi:DUF1290 domain-containing protein [Virgibacillus dakarensis]|nr:DUF1290 domain-containing protein [Virgibacillus dakarensis]MTW85338.1 DUF1290 domain-containing protein [Virgibacillus dakarensis]
MGKPHFISGFLNNGIRSGLTFISLQWGIDLYLAAIFAFGIRLLQTMQSAACICLKRNFILRKRKKVMENKREMMFFCRNTLYIFYF